MIKNLVSPFWLHSNHSYTQQVNICVPAHPPTKGERGHTGFSVDPFGVGVRFRDCIGVALLPMKSDETMDGISQSCIDIVL